MKQRTGWIRRAIQWSVLGLTVGLSLMHIYGNKAVWAPLDAYCPFGGLESFWRLVTEAKFLSKTQPSNLALGLGLVLTTLIFGGIFCGWICPLGTIQDGLFKLGRLLKLPQLKVAPGLDKYLRWLRYGLLGLVLVESFQLTKLWFADYDPFRIIFGLHWISEPEGVLVQSWIIVIVFLILAMLIRRFWCRFLCPLGLIIQWLSKISIFRLRWNQKECVNCNLCTKNCPMALEVQEPQISGTECNHCLECTTVCPKPEALKYQAPLGSGTKLAVGGVAFFGIILIAAQLLGWWNPKIGSDPESIKGWMTFSYVADKFGISFEEMKKELKLSQSITENSQLSSLEGLGGELNTDGIRQYVAKRLGLSYTAKEAEKAVTTEMGPEVGIDKGAGDPKSAEPKETVTPNEKISQPGTTEEKVNTESSHIGLENEVKPAASSSEVPDPGTMKGTMSLKEVSTTWKIPVTTLLQKLNLPANLDPNQPIRELREVYGVEKSKVEEIVKELIK